MVDQDDDVIEEELKEEAYELESFLEEGLEDDWSSISVEDKRFVQFNLNHTFCNNKCFVTRISRSNFKSKTSSAS